MKRSIGVLFLALGMFLFPKIVSAEGVQIVEVDPTVESEMTACRIVLPEDMSQQDNPVWVQLRVKSYPLGSITEQPRAKELVNDKIGQSIHVVLDNEPYFARVGARVEPFDEEGNYFDARYRFKLKNPLKPGYHTLRVFLARSFGESLKGRDVFDATCFYVDKKSGDACHQLKDPYLTYNMPSNSMVYTEDKPILLDFYLQNCELSPDGFKVKLTLDDKIVRILTKWSPYYIYHLKKGTHTCRLELLDKNNQVVKGSFNDVKQKFRIE